MTKKHLLFLLAIIVAAGVIFTVRSKSKEKHQVVVKEVMELHQGTEPQIQKITERKIELRKQIDELKMEAQNLRSTAKTVKAVSDAEKNEKINKLNAEAEEIEQVVRELEGIETEIYNWREEVGSALKNQKDKVTKAVHDQLTAAKAKIAQISDKLGKAMEKTGKSMQQQPEKTEEKK